MSEGNPATPKQQNVLADFGYNPNVTFDEASKLIDAIAKNGWKRPSEDGEPEGPRPTPKSNVPRDGSNPCTAKQAACLEKFGMNPNVTFAQASAALDALAANNWQPLAEPVSVAQTAPAPAGDQYGDLPSFG